MEDCRQTGCANDIACLLTPETGRYECLKTSKSIFDDKCRLDDIGKTNCTSCPSGPGCENIDDICLLKNPCLNNGICSPKVDKMFTCKCTHDYEGLLCERLKIKMCKLQMNRGRIFAHPKDKQAFVSCLANGDYRSQKCPNGLVFDQKIRMCDYSTEPADQ